MTPSPIDRDNVDLNTLFTGIVATMGPFLTDFRDEISTTISTMIWRTLTFLRQKYYFKIIIILVSYDK